MFFFSSCRETNYLIKKIPTPPPPPPTENQMVHPKQATDSQVNYLLECTICITYFEKIHMQFFTFKCLSTKTFTFTEEII